MSRHPFPDRSATDDRQLDSPDATYPDVLDPGPQSPHGLTHRSALFLLFGLWLILFFSALFSPALLDDADATHASAARHIALSGDWVTLHVNGIRYLEKAPLPYWLVALCFKIFGFNAFATHLPQALGVLLLTLLGYRWANEAFGRRAALYTGLATLTSAGVFLFTRIFIPEVLLSLFLCTALYCFLQSLYRFEASPLSKLSSCALSSSKREAPASGISSATNLYPYAMWVALALAVLTKGLVALVFIFGTAIVYLALTGDYKKWRALKPFSGVLLFLAIAAPWHVLASLRNTGGMNGHGFFWFYFINEHVLRFLGRRIPMDYNKLPGYLFWSLHLVWLFPWALFAPLPIVALIRRWKRRRAETLSPRAYSGFAQRTTLLLALFSALVLGFFSLSTNQEYYTFPAYLPLLILLCAALTRAEAEFTEDRSSRRWIIFAHATLTVIGLAIAATLAYGLWIARSLPFVPDIGDLLAHRGIGHYTLSMSHLFDLTGPSFAALRLPAALAALAFAFGPAIAWFLRTKRHHLTATFTIAVTSAIFLIAAHIALIRFGPMLSSQDLAEKIQQLEDSGAIAADREVLLFGDQSYGSSIVFYLDQSTNEIPDLPIALVEGRSSSMLFGSSFADAPQIFLTNTDLLKMWGVGTRKILFVPLEKRDIVDHLLGDHKFLLAETSGKALFTDRPLDALPASPSDPSFLEAPPPPINTIARAPYVIVAILALLLAAFAIAFRLFPPGPNPPWNPRSIAVLLLAWLILQLGGIFTPGLLDDVDSVYIEIAREMLHRHDYVTPYIDGIRFFDKPPLIYWMASSSMAIFGESDWAARIPLTLAVLALLLSVYALGIRLLRSLSPPDHPDRGGLYAALALATGIGPYLFTRFYIPDILICLWMTLAVHLTLIAIERLNEASSSNQNKSSGAPSVQPDRTGGNVKRQSALLPCIAFAATLALNLLTKGLIGLVFPIAFVFLYLAFTKQLRLLPKLHPIASTTVFLAIAAPWHILAALRNPAIALPAGLGLPLKGGWAWFYLYNEHIARFLSKRIPHDYGQTPVWLFWLMFLIWAMPWATFLPAAAGLFLPQLRRRLTATAQEHEAALSLSLWIAIIIGFFTFSARQEYYSLPALPALALLAGGALAWSEAQPTSNTRGSILDLSLYLLIPITVLIAAVCGYFAITAPHAPPGTDLATLLSSNPDLYNLSLGHLYDLTGAAMGLFRGPLTTVALGMIAIGPIAYALHRSKHTFAANLTLAAGITVVLLAAHEGLVRFNPILGSKDLAEAINTARRNSQPAANNQQPDLVILDGELTSGSTLVFYTRQQVHLINGRVNGLWYGSFWPDAPAVFETEDSLRTLWSSPRRIFLFTYNPTARQRDLTPYNPVHTLASAGGKTILTNH